MTVKRYQKRRCCGKIGYIFEAPKPVLRQHVAAFRQAGYTINDQNTKLGRFQATIKGLTATCMFGTNRLDVTCVSQTCKQLLDTFAANLDRIVTSNG